MAYEIVTELRCKTNERKDGKGYASLTVGEIYESACSNSSINADSFMVYDDEGDLYSFDKKYFEITKTITKENTGWKVQCKDCGKEISLKDIFESNKICPRCGQKFDIY